MEVSKGDEGKRGGVREGEEGGDRRKERRIRLINSKPTDTS